MIPKNIWRIHGNHGTMTIDKSVQWNLKNGAVRISRDMCENELDAKTFETGNCRMFKIFKERCKINDLIWMKDACKIYYLGKITSGLIYDASDKTDLIYLRKCSWKEAGKTVTGKISNSFINPSTIIKLYEGTVSCFSLFTWNKYNIDKFELDVAGKGVVDMLDQYGLKELIERYLNDELNFLLIPSVDLPKDRQVKYEDEFVQKKTGKEAILQICNGNSGANRDLYLDFVQNSGKQVYLFDKDEKYFGVENENIICLRKKDISKYITDNIELLPEIVGIWYEYLEDYRKLGEKK